MRFKTFISLVSFGVLIFSTLVVYSCSRILSSTAAPTVQPAPTANIQPETQRPLSVAEIRQKLDGWLRANPDRVGATRSDNILPNERFRANAIRFPPETANRWSNDERQWSQIRLDLNRDGIEDEKWLLKNGLTWKRETLDPQGKVVETQYFY